MKKIFFITLFLLFGCSTQQEISIKENSKLVNINLENYYEYEIKSPPFGAMVKTDWIRDDEIVDILFNEFEKLGYKLIKNNLFKLNDEEFVIVDGFYEKEKFGFIVESGHSVPIRISDRDKNKSLQYTMYHSGGRPKFVYTKAIPENIFIFRENWYWFQECNGCDTQTIVTKEIAKKILIEDLNKYLTKFQNQ